MIGFTERARHVLNRACVVARRLNSEMVGSEHILLCLVAEGGGLAAKILKDAGVDFVRVRPLVDGLSSPHTTGRPTVSDRGFSPSATRVLELAQEAADSLGHDARGTEHLLLGMLQENEGAAAGILLDLGVHPYELDAKLKRVLGVEPADSSVTIDSKTRTSILVEIIGACPSWMDSELHRLMLDIVKMEQEKDKAISVQEFERAAGLRDKARAASQAVDKRLKELDAHMETPLARRLINSFFWHAGCPKGAGESKDDLPNQARLIYAAGDIACLEGHRGCPESR